ncbi:MAG: L,D-transpeptidase [Coriobacteriales bacterium]|nr:L,D-transpeptidase [Coriobacteriales bacterium]
MQIQKRGNRQIVRRRPSPKAIRPYSEGQQYKLRRRPMVMPEADAPTEAATTATPASVEAVVDETSMPVEGTARESLDQTAPLQSDSSAKLDQAKEVIVESASAVASVAGSVVSNIPDVARGAYGKAQEILPDENPLKGLHLRERLARLVKRISGLSLKRWQKITIACVAVLVVYALGALLASFRMPAHAFLNGRDVSGMSKGAFVEQARGYADDYTLKVSGDGVNLDLHAKDIDLKYDADAFTQSVLSKTSGWTWPIDLFFTHNWEVTDGITLDQTRLDQAVSNAVTWANKTATFPKSASIAYDSKSGKFNGVKQEYGTAVNEDSAKAKTLAAASTLRPEVQLGEEDILQPKITLDDDKFNKVLEEANARSGIKLDLQIDGKRIAIVDPSLLMSWITVDENGNVVGDIDAITKWTRGDFSATIDTVGTTRTYTRPDGKQVTAEGGEYGWSVDGAQLATIIADRIAKISSDPIEVPFQSKGKVLAKGTPDWGKRFIDVDLSEQYVRMYDDDGNCIWESLCVSGDTGNDQGTITGVYAIEKKESPATLVGLDYDGDGEPDYENEVNFWMPFYGGFGLHDATWRYSFGGDLFKYEGSHGCVNLPYDTAESLYSYVDKGDPVVVHW